MHYNTYCAFDIHSLIELYWYWYIGSMKRGVNVPDEVRSYKSVLDSIMISKQYESRCFLY